MKSLLRFTVFFVLIITASFNAQISDLKAAINQLKVGYSIIPEIRKGTFDREVIIIRGLVLHAESVPQKSTVQYWIKNVYGDMIPVVSSLGYPEVGKKYEITGTINLSITSLTFNNIVATRFIDEKNRVEVESLWEIKDNGTQEEAQNRIILATNDLNEKNKWWFNLEDAEKKLNEAQTKFELKNYEGAILSANEAENLAQNPPYSFLLYLVIIAAIILIALIVVLIYLFAFKRREKSPRLPLETKLPEPIQLVGSTVKMNLPPPGTLKVLPGRFEIIEGETQIKEIRFLKTSNEQDLEFTFGKNPGEPYKHIQIAHPTVSHDQARVLFGNNAYTLINRADPVKSNATKINNVEMTLNQVVQLKDGDRVTMGTVVMVYHQN